MKTVSKDSIRHIQMWRGGKKVNQLEEVKGLKEGFFTLSVNCTGCRCQGDEKIQLGSRGWKQKSKKEQLIHKAPSQKGKGPGGGTGLKTELCSHLNHIMPLSRHACFLFRSLWGVFLFVCLFDCIRCGMRNLSCGIWDLVPWQGLEPGPPALGARSLCHQTTREVSIVLNYYFLLYLCFMILINV